MTARFVMLPSASGDFVLDANRIVSGRDESGITRLVLLGGVSIDVTAPIERVREIAGCLRFQIDAEGQTAYFNHRHLDFASITDAGTILAFTGGAGARSQMDSAETLLQLLNRLEAEAPG